MIFRFCAACLESVARGERGRRLWVKLNLNLGKNGRGGRIFYVIAPVYELLFITMYGTETVTNILFPYFSMANTGIQYAEYRNSVFTHISYYGIPEIDESRYSLAYTNTGIR